MLGVKKTPLLPLELQLQMERDERNKAEKEALESRLAEEERDNEGLTINFKEAGSKELQEIDDLDDDGFFMNRIRDKGIESEE